MAVHPNCHILAVTGGKGGVGKSVFAANLALAFLQEMKRPTLLIDMDQLSCGDQNVILGIRDAKTLNDLAAFQGSIQPASLASYCSPHTSGLQFIAAVKNREDTINNQNDLLMRQIDSLSNIFSYIIVDVGSSLSSLQMNLIERATGVMMLTIPEVLAVNQTAKLIGDLMSATLPADLIQIVVNRAASTGLAPAAIGQTLRRNVLAALPQDDASVSASLQRSTPFVLSMPKAPLSLMYFETVRKLTGGLLQQMRSIGRPQALKVKEAPSKPESSVSSGPTPLKAAPGVDSRTAMKLSIHNELIKAIDLKKTDTDTQGDPEKERELRKKTQGVISQIVDREAQGVGREERSAIIKEVLEEALGLGPLEDLLADPAISEIMVNGYQKIYVEKKGLIQLYPVHFTSNFHLRKVIERIVAPLGRQINENVPYVDARLKDGSRVNAVINPVSIDGPALTIRKFSKKRVTPEMYVNDFGGCNMNMMDFLRICVQNHLNIIISGGTGSGKTTLLNLLSSFIPSNERIVTIEDAAELQLLQDHVVRLETRPANMEGTGQISIRDLVKNSLRMRPDRIVVGECRDGAALDMLSAMSTGHDGSMTTVHSNNPREAIGRLETLCLMAGMDLPAKAIREQITNAVNLIVQVSRLSDGSRRITQITEVQELQGETVIQQDVFEFKERSFDKNRKIIGDFRATGRIPKFIEEFERRGVSVPRSIFGAETPGKMASGDKK